MSVYTKALTFVVIAIVLGLAAMLTPYKPIKVESLDTVPKSVALAPKTSVNTTSLLQQYQSRPLFTSKLIEDANLAENVQTSIAEDWSPLDYQLIGISRSAGKTTGWFKHVETGGLTSGRQGMQLGNWTLDYLSSTEAKLSSEGKTESLKLFQGREPR